MRFELESNNVIGKRFELKSNKLKPRSVTSLSRLPLARQLSQSMVVF